MMTIGEMIQMVNIAKWLWQRNKFVVSAEIVAGSQGSQVTLRVVSGGSGCMTPMRYMIRYANEKPSLDEVRPSVKRAVLRTIRNGYRFNPEQKTLSPGGPPYEERIPIIKGFCPIAEIYIIDQLGRKWPVRRKNLRSLNAMIETSRHSLVLRMFGRKPSLPWHKRLFA